MFGDFRAKNSIRTLYVYVVLAKLYVSKELLKQACLLRKKARDVVFGVCWECFDQISNLDIQNTCLSVPSILHLQEILSRVI